ncbi:MAG: 3-deoxy-manno-octulosonate cytidylyltransferase [Gammaproteobacteria bacterium]|nr:3-deoxy-manno-octulosonate cytidylyltransferase [Gammaproteobacteria bacterium]
MTFSVIIPARYHSSRLPGKPLLELHGQSMLQRVYQQACKSNACSVYIATDHDDILNHAQSFCDQVIMTRQDHATGTDRLQEVVQHLALPSDHIVVNVQGDEPLIPPNLIDQVATNLRRHSHAAIATLAEPIVDVAQVFDPNAVKLVRNAANMAMYFSRSPLPWDRSWGDTKTKHIQTGVYLRHIGLYAYRVGFLHRYVTWPQANYEGIESLEQLRALHHGEAIHVDLAPEGMPSGVDTPEDLANMRDYLASMPSLSMEA